jgi:hypothetical protein
MTYTLQHGFENLGLTYRDRRRGSGVTFAAQRVLCWGEVDRLPGRLHPETRGKCVAVGCPKRHLEELETAGKPSGKPIISIFEGLHVARFDHRYLTCFFDDLQQTADEFKDFRFILKPHPGIVERRPEHARRLAALRDIEVLDPARPRTAGDYPTPRLLADSVAAVTTPSTIALDAALAGTPAAVTRYRQNLPYYDLYHPLPLLDTGADWRKFLQTIRHSAATARDRTIAFRDRVMLPGDAAGRILDLIAGEV